MTTLLHQRLDMYRFQLALVIVLIALFSWFLSNYYQMLQAAAEERVVIYNMQTIRNLFKAYVLVNQNRLIKSDAWLDMPPTYLKQSSLNVQILTGENDKPNAGQWSYDIKHRRFIYSVMSSKYFQNKNQTGYILLQILKNNGRYILKANNYRWCQNKHIWGCDWG